MTSHLVTALTGSSILNFRPADNVHPPSSACNAHSQVSEAPCEGTAFPFGSVGPCGFARSEEFPGGGRTDGKTNRPASGRGCVRRFAARLPFEAQGRPFGLAQDKKPCPDTVVRSARFPSLGSRQVRARDKAKGQRQRQRRAAGLKSAALHLNLNGKCKMPAYKTRRPLQRRRKGPTLPDTNRRDA